MDTKCFKLDPNDLKYQSSEQYLIVCLRLCNLILKNECSIEQLINLNYSMNDSDKLFLSDSPHLLSHLNSSECHKYSHKESHKMILFIFGAILCLTILTLNLLTLITILKSRRLQSIQNILIANLSISDFLSGISFMYPCILNLLTIYALETYNSSLYKLAGMIRQYYYLCLAGYSPMITSMLSSMFTLSLLAIEKYIAILHPYFYERLINQHRIYCYVCLILSWSISILVSLLPLMGWNEITNKSNFVPCMFEKIFTLNYILLFTSICCFCAFTMLAIYLRIYFIARKHSKQIAKIQSLVILSNVNVNPNEQVKKSLNDNFDLYELIVKEKRSEINERKMSRSISHVDLIGLDRNKNCRRYSSPAILLSNNKSIEIKCVESKKEEKNSQIKPNSHNLNVNMKAMKTLLILLLGFYICWLPLIGYFLTFASKKYDNLTIYILMFIACCNACIDPIVYAFRNKEFLKALLGNFRKETKQSTQNLIVKKRFNKSYSISN
ncbi:unnamed protein product [Brachionus calyciflorus]|uniref:G-protein coupled receptors family 1 profile domain-containing protein n=1 Tax=Brachionus calyciflorus TaxID=104777 RepID=A0A813M2K5_9BILA|nr:unnamed protein product [Brachionus calyciflorus]